MNASLNPSQRQGELHNQRVVKSIFHRCIIDTCTGSSTVPNHQQCFFTESQYSSINSVNQFDGINVDNSKILQLGVVTSGRSHDVHHPLVRQTRFGRVHCILDFRSEFFLEAKHPCIHTRAIRTRHQERTTTGLDFVIYGAVDGSVEDSFSTGISTQQETSAFCFSVHKNTKWTKTLRFPDLFRFPVISRLFNQLRTPATDFVEAVFIFFTSIGQQIKLRVLDGLGVGLFRV